MSTSFCDVCDIREGKRWIRACQIETWVCDPCSGINSADYDEPTTDQPEALDIPPTGRASRMRAGRS